MQEFEQLLQDNMEAMVNEVGDFYAAAAAEVHAVHHDEGQDEIFNPVPRESAPALNTGRTHLENMPMPEEIANLHHIEHVLRLQGAILEPFEPASIHSQSSYSPAMAEALYLCGLRKRELGYVEPSQRQSRVRCRRCISIVHPDVVAEAYHFTKDPMENQAVNALSALFIDAYRLVLPRLQNCKPTELEHKTASKSRMFLEILAYLMKWLTAMLQHRWPNNQIILATQGSKQQDINLDHVTDQEVWPTFRVLWLQHDLTRPQKKTSCDWLISELNKTRQHFDFFVLCTLNPLPTKATLPHALAIFYSHIFNDDAYKACRKKHHAFYTPGRMITPIGINPAAKRQSQILVHFNNKRGSYSQ